MVYDLLKNINGATMTTAEVTIEKKKYNIICMYGTNNPTTQTMEVFFIES
jgi:hypothetical protein